MLGLHPLHIEMTALQWFLKVAKHQDFRHWRCTGNKSSFQFFGLSENTVLLDKKVLFSDNNNF